MGVIVFDLDGTLIDSVPDLCVAMNAVLSANARRSISEAQTREMTGSGARILVDRAMVATGGSLEPAALEVAYRSFLDVYGAYCCVRTRPYPGVPELLEALRGEYGDLGLCTNKPIGHTDQILAKLGLLHYFPCRFGGDSLPTKKPSPEMVVTCIEELGGRPAEAILVGDSAVDEQAAQAAGCGFLGVRYGYGAKAFSASAATVGAVGDIRRALGSI